MSNNFQNFEKHQSGESESNIEAGNTDGLEVDNRNVMVNVNMDANLDRDVNLDANVKPEAVRGGNSGNKGNENGNSGNLEGGNSGSGNPEGGDSNQGAESVESGLNTLDESIWDTLKRDLKRIWNKLGHVLLPRLNAAKEKELQNWDLWGPLLFCLGLCITLSYTTKDNDDKKLDKDGKEIESDNSGIFIIIFFVVWIGGCIITVNAQFLGGKSTFFQVLCLLGYCLFPINVCSLVIRIINIKNFIKVIILAFGYVWACYASVGFMSGLVPKEKRMVCVYPVFLFYLFLSWFVLTL